MDNDDIRLMAYVDGELDAEEARCVEQMLENDAEARARVAMFRETASVLRSACAEGFYQAETARLGVLHPARGTSARVGRRFAAVAAACLLAAAAGFGGGRLSVLPGSARDSLLDEVAEYHEVFSRESLHLVEVPADHKAEFQTWMENRLGRRFGAPDLSSSGLRFAGGRMLVVDGKPVAEMMYTRAEGRPVALCITPMAAEAEPMRVDKRKELWLASWTDGGYAFVVVGELEPGSATSIAEAARTQVQS